MAPLAPGRVTAGGLWAILVCQGCLPSVFFHVTVLLFQSGWPPPAMPLWPLKLNCHVFHFIDHLQADIGPLFVAKTA